MTLRLEGHEIKQITCFIPQSLLSIDVCRFMGIVTEILLCDLNCEPCVITDLCLEGHEITTNQQVTCFIPQGILSIDVPIIVFHMANLWGNKKR